MTAINIIDEIQVRDGYLYLLQNTTVGGFKIGLTTSPESRFKALAVGSKSKLIAYWKHTHYREIEKYYHQRFKQERVPQSEYFDLTDEQVQMVIGEMCACSEVQHLEPNWQPIEVISRLRFVEQMRKPIDMPVGFGWLASGIAAAALMLMYVS